MLITLAWTFPSIGTCGSRNGTLVRILTEDGGEQIFRSIAHFLTYQGIDLHRHQVRELYFEILKEQQRASPEEHPEFDAVGIWRSILQAHLTEFTRALPAEKLEQMRATVDEKLSAAQIAEVVESEHKVLVFSQFTSMLFLIAGVIERL